MKHIMLFINAINFVFSPNPIFADDSSIDGWLTPEIKESLTENQILTLRHFRPEERAESLKHLKQNENVITEEVKQFFDKREIDIILLLSPDQVQQIIEIRKKTSPVDRRTEILRSQGILYDVWDVLNIIAEEKETEGLFDERIRETTGHFKGFFITGTFKPLDENYVFVISKVLTRTSSMKRQKPLNPHRGTIPPTVLEEFQIETVYIVGRELFQRAENGLNPVLPNWHVRGDSLESFNLLLNLLMEGAQKDCLTRGDWELRSAYIQGVRALRALKWSDSLERPDKLDTIHLLDFNTSIYETKEYQEWVESKNN